MRSILLLPALLLSASLGLGGCVRCSFDPIDYEERGTTVITLEPAIGCSGGGAHLVVVDGLYWTTSPGASSYTTLPMRFHIGNGRHTVKVIDYDVGNGEPREVLLTTTLEVTADTTLVVPCGP